MKRQRYGKHRFKFSLRVMLGTVAFIALSIVTIQYGWPRRSVQKSVAVPEVDANIYAPHIQEVVQASDTITKLDIDRRTNTIVVTAEARNIDAAVNEVHLLVRDPSLIAAAAALSVTLDEIREMRAE